MYTTENCLCKPDLDETSPHNDKCVVDGPVIPDPEPCSLRCYATSFPLFRGNYTPCQTTDELVGYYTGESDINPAINNCDPAVTADCYC